MTLPEKDSFETYGGTKLDFIDVVDPTTDRSAEEVNKAFASGSMMTRTATRAIVSFAADGTDGYNQTVYDHEALWGNTLDLIPTVYKNSTGLWTITWPATVTDPLGEEHNLNLKWGWAQYQGASFGHVQVTVTSPNVCQVRLFDAAGSLQNGPNASARIQVFLI